MRARLLAASLLVVVCVLPARAEPLPGFKTVSEDTSESRRIVSIRIEQRIGEDDLARIATGLRKGDQDGRRTLVNFYLPGMNLKETSWATVSFTPALKISVHGLTLAEEAAYRTEASHETRPIVGMWLTQAPAVPGLLVIFREKGKLFAEWRVRGGHRTVEEVVESRWNGGRRFDIAGDAGQHYVLVAGGVLELRETSGLIAAAEPVKPEVASAKAKVPVPKVANAAQPANAQAMAQVAAAPVPAAAPARSAVRPAAGTTAPTSASITVTNTPAPVAAPASLANSTQTPATPAATGSVAASASAEPSAKLAASAKAEVSAAAPVTAPSAAVTAGNAASAQRAKPSSVAEKTASRTPVKKRVAKTEPAPAPKKRFEADVSAINKRLVN